MHGGVMRALIVLVTLLIAINVATCTIDVKKLKETAQPLLQTLTDSASAKLHTITDEAATKLQTLKQKASSTLHQLSQNAQENIQDIVKSIDLNNLKKLDFLDVIPKVHNKLAHKLAPKKKIKFVKVFTEKEFLHEDNIFPWPVVRRKTLYIYD